MKEFNIKILTETFKGERSRVCFLALFRGECGCIEEAVLGGSELLSLEVYKQRLTSLQNAMEDTASVLAGSLHLMAPEASSQL